jgi:YVTN family beta-propeller protein
LVLVGGGLAPSAAGAASAYAVTASLPVGPGTLELAGDASLQRVYVSTIDGIDVFDTAARGLVTQAPVVSPGALAVDAEAHRVYAAHAGTGTITVMDGTTNGSAGSFDVNGIVPTALAVDPSSHRVFATNIRDSSLSVLEGTTAAVAARVPVGTGPATLDVNRRRARTGSCPNRCHPPAGTSLR